MGFPQPQAKDGGGFTIDYDDWHKECHHFLDYQELLKPDPELKALLDGIPLKKWVFTNADKTHAEEALAALGLAECFDGVIHFESVMEAAAREGLLSDGGVLCKPNPEVIPRDSLFPARFPLSEHSRDPPPLLSPITMQRQCLAVLVAYPAALILLQRLTELRWSPRG